MNEYTPHEADHPAERPEETPEHQPFRTLRDVEREHIERVLDEVRWNQRRAARILGISRWSLSRRLRKYELTRDGSDTEAS
jgi:transcriptional regulator with GAF, ATPase, and Fis domain